VGAVAEGGPSSGIGSGPRLEVEVVRHGEAWDPAPLTDAMFTRAAEAAFVAAPPLSPGAYEATIVLTDDAEMRDLNRIWRGKDAPTNVLSFPAEDRLYEPSLLGDVVLAYETARKEAREQNLALADHVSHLVVHGMLHLLGFDHIEDDEAERMEDLERKALASLGIADPYADEDEVRPAEVSS
jgi:probable rRNA maturation factor